MSRRSRDPAADREAARYEHPIASREFILDELRKAGAPLAFPALRERVASGATNETEALRRRLRAMCRDGQLLIDRRGRYALVEKLDLVRGRVRMQRSGHARLAVEDSDGKQVFIHERQARVLMDGDRVLVRLRPWEEGDEPEGVVVEILERNPALIVGRYHAEGGIAFVEPERNRLNQDIVIPPDADGGARNGDYVKVELSVAPGLHQPPVGRVVEVVGGADSSGVEADIVLEAFGIPQRFSRTALKQAAGFGATVAESDKQARVDLRSLPLVTIDGADARDFDDAVYCERRPRGGFRLVVAIADVAHYVAPGSALDEAALERGNSVYFPDRVIPMLPEALSNELCSLRPLVDRLCMVCDMQISAHGRLTRYVFYEAVMCSAARLTYTQVERLLRPVPDVDTQPSDGQSPAGNSNRHHAGAKLDSHRGRSDDEPPMPDLTPATLESLHNLDAVYGALREQREQRGALDFETRETRIRITERGHIDAIVPVRRQQSNQLIEECMIAANVASARFLDRHGIAGLYRVHDKPKPTKVAELRTVLDALGIRIPVRDGEMTPAVMADLLVQLRRRRGGSVFEPLVLRALQQAVYSPKNLGHFGLALPQYAHFTSPIRRYPDLLLHRAIKSVIHSRKRTDLVQRPRGTERFESADVYPYDADDMRMLGEQTSMTERRAEEAVRDLEAWLKCEYMQQHLGDAFPGRVASVTPFGLFVELDSLYVQGLVHVTALGGDYYHYDAAAQRLVGENSGVAFGLGDALEVIVSRVDPAERRIDFVPVQPLDEITRQPRGRKRTAHQTRAAGGRGRSGGRRGRRR